MQYNRLMGSVVEARLDADTQKTLTQLAARLGMSKSQVVREGIRLVAVSHPRFRKRRIVGVGMSASGIPDLGSNKKHLEGLGR